MRLPAYCPTCGDVFPSGFSVSSGVNIRFDGNQSGPCRNGHMGLVADGTFDVVDGLLKVRDAGPATAQIIARIEEIGALAISGAVNPKDALDEIASVLPKESAAAIKKLGVNNPIAIIIIIIAILTQGATIYSAFKPNAPQPASTINNNITINNDGASRGRGNKPLLEGRSVRSGGREKMKGEKKKLAAETRAQAREKGACPPRKKPKPPKNYQRHQH